MKNIFDEISKEISKKSYNKKVRDILFTKNEFIFVASKKGPNYIDKLYKGGTRKTGKNVNGEWTEEVEELLK